VRRKRLVSGLVSVRNVPAYSLEQALRVARAMLTVSYKPPGPECRGAMKMTRLGSFRMLTGAAISLRPLQRAVPSRLRFPDASRTRIVRPTKPGDDLNAKARALLKRGS